MRILIIHTRYQQAGGEDQAVENERKLLEQNGCIVRTLVFDNNNNPRTNLLLLPFNPVSFFRTLRAILEFGPDVAHLHNLHFAASPAVVWALKSKGIPMVKTLHNYRLLCPSGTLFHQDKLFLSSITASFPWAAVRSGAYRHSGGLTFWLAFSTWLHRKIGTWRHVGRFIVLTEAGRQLFLQSDCGLTREQLVIKPNFSLSVPAVGGPRGPHYLYVGRLSEEKGIRTLLQAFATNGRQLTIAGDGPLGPELRRHTAGNPCITWLGQISDRQVREQLAQCTALILPSLCFEGMPLSILEAFAGGTPVIASRLGAMESMIRHGKDGLLFSAGDPGDLNRQLEIIQASGAAGRQRLSLNARHTYENYYTPEINWQQLSFIYKSAMNEKGKSTQHFGKYRIVQRVRVGDSREGGY